jgi:hypothetical protein
MPGNLCQKHLPCFKLLLPSQSSILLVIGYIGFSTLNYYGPCIAYIIFQRNLIGSLHFVSTLSTPSLA